MPPSPACSDVQPGAYFGRPVPASAPGGFHVAVYVVPVLERRLVVFDIDGPGEIAGRWLPWAVLPFQGNPYEAASALADSWCDVPMDDLRLIDVMSFAGAGENWELALVFRAELAERPAGDATKQAAFLDPRSLDAIGPFDPVDLARWLMDERRSPRDQSHPGLIF